MRKNIVAVFVFKKKIEGKPWAYVADFDNEQKFKDWVCKRDYLFSDIAFTKGEVFNTINEVEEFKDWLKGMLDIGPTPNFDEDKFNHCFVIYDGMAHYEEEEFGKVYLC